jgi:hypothetical protein
VAWVPPGWGTGRRQLLATYETTLVPAHDAESSTGICGTTHKPTHRPPRSALHHHLPARQQLKSPGSLEATQVTSQTRTSSDTAESSADRSELDVESRSCEAELLVERPGRLVSAVDVQDDRVETPFLLQVLQSGDRQSLAEPGSLM